MKVTRSENELIWALRDMVGQHCDDTDGVLDTGYIRCNRTAMELLVKYGHAEAVNPPDDDGYFRWYQVRLVAREKTPNAFGKDVVDVDMDVSCVPPTALLSKRQLGQNGRPGVAPDQREGDSTTARD